MSDSLDPVARRVEAAPLNVNAHDLRQLLSAAKTFVGKCREANERRPFDEGGAIHLSYAAQRQFREAIAPFVSATSKYGDDPTTGGIKALLDVAGDGQVAPDIDRLEAVIAWIDIGASRTARTDARRICGGIRESGKRSGERAGRADHYRRATNVAKR